MLDGLTERLHKDIQTFKNVLDAHDHARALYDEPAKTHDHWTATRETGVTKSDWHIYDHCAAFTRLYAIYATFVEELIETYLGILPSLYPSYDALPKSVTTQHRIGLSTILAKLGDGGGYSYLDEKTIIITLADGLNGNTPYRLLKPAFLPDRQNYRMEIIGRLLGYLGVSNAIQRLSNNRCLQEFLSTVKPGGTTVQNELDQFVRRRNEAAHSDVNTVVASEEVKRTAEFILLLGNALADILNYAITNRRFEMGHFPKLGTVEKTHQKGSVIISHVTPCVLRLGEQLVIVFNNNLELATITGLHLNDVSHEDVFLTEKRGLGIKLDKPAKVGAAIHALRSQQTAPHQVLGVFEQRIDEIIGLLIDDFLLLGFITDNGADVEIESVDNVELDNPDVVRIDEDSALLAVTAHLTFTATATYEDPSSGIYDSEDKVLYFMEKKNETVQRTVRIPFEVLIRFGDVASRADGTTVTVTVQKVNAGEDVEFDLERPEDLR